MLFSSIRKEFGSLFVHYIHVANKIYKKLID